MRVASFVDQQFEGLSSARSFGILLISFSVASNFPETKLYLDGAYIWVENLGISAKEEDEWCGCL
jgi:hypothetical protein